jgi:thymidine kinase
VGGRIEVICGCMSSGKSAELISRLSRHEAAGKAVVAIKHSVDVRYSTKELVSRTGVRRAATVVPDAHSIVTVCSDVDVVGIDETQFFGEGLSDVTAQLKARGRTVIVSGLDIDAWDRPFPPIPEIAKLADEVTVLTALCAVCRGPATLTQRVAPLSPDDRRVGRTRLVGDGDLFEPRCRDHFVPLSGD